MPDRSLETYQDLSLPERVKTCFYPLQATRLRSDVHLCCNLNTTGSLTYYRNTLCGKCLQSKYKHHFAHNSDLLIADPDTLSSLCFCPLLSSAF